MIQEIGEHVFCNEYVVCEPAAGDYMLHYRDRGCLTRVTGAGGADAWAAGDVFELPRLRDFGDKAPDQLVYAFAIGEQRFWIALCDEVCAPEGFAYEAISWLRYAEPAELLFAAVTGSQLDRWYRDNRFCPRCGHATELGPRSREVVCPECAKITYPKICPGIICGVVDCEGETERIALTRYNGRTTALWALVAGFTEIGEPLEDTVRREVMEEIGLKVKNLRFYKSQPWSFSDTLLVGFWAEVDGDPTIRVDHEELKEARWFTRDEMTLERADDRVSLTGEMIEQFRLRGREVLVVSPGASAVLATEQ
ncbi:NAD(+) diphosphatase [Paratractidigestivibacter sp.]|uniref:NAD(+) diphosphatase n=1 Tax=Paratractidigestivibacter sp. TaxID=2847316 RepID=UPI002AC8D29B|nr:NAD(+) diphosphatase [Paratractidigestivibacter sp.]